MQIYLDYSATTPCHPDVIIAMGKVWTEQWGNPSSLHEWGQRSATVLEQARMQVADLIHAPAESIIFTSGGTEANNLALMGIARTFTQPQHLIISSIEHSAITEPARLLEQQGWQVTRLPVDSQGHISPDDLKDSFQSNTVLVSVIYGQSEIGTLQSIHTLGQIARERGVLFHTDAVQVAGRLPIDVQTLPVDLLSLSSHKLYGPQGAGALYVRPGTHLIPLSAGGGQEQGMRSGTPAVPILAGFGLAAEMAAEEMESEGRRLMLLRDRMFAQLSHSPYLLPTGDLSQRLPHHVSFCLHPATDITGKTLVRQMNLAGIAISAGSACHSGKLAPSPILKAMGYSDQQALSGIRLTLGKQTTLEDVDWTVTALNQLLHRLMPQSAAIA
ncbi:cysteine desulfurase family protein [Acaryochloris sp. CCMEE 5410]|uniref:cysteine desulfurase family protein n=1 Tax=Acaryochloris sp. CCMEE 5410 TaxID=310037 RepID=UPI0002484A87|nr:cysteine desulfurase family protein [Acaryochloris sp. CCMEE 5410]KAI9133169.1 cysteine desulfurase [Acaryochloris sp. CCMEE 5410]